MILMTVANATQPNISVVWKSNNIIFTLKNSLGLPQDKAKSFKPNEKYYNLTITNAKVRRFFVYLFKTGAISKETAPYFDVSQNLD